MTRAELVRQREQLEWELSSDRGMPSSCRAYRSDEIRRLDALLAALDEAEQHAGEAKRRAAVTAALLPVQEYSRPFLKHLADHGLGIVLANRLAVRVCAKGESRSQIALRTLFTPGITNEEEYAHVLHECGHLLDPFADGRQHRYIQTKENTRIAPLSEAFAWKWAIEHCWRHLWTERMNHRLTHCLGSYKSHAQPDELAAIELVLSSGLASIRPAPDTHEGRLAIVKAIEEEQRFEQSNTGRALRRLEELGLRLPSTTTTTDVVDDVRYQLVKIARGEGQLRPDGGVAPALASAQDDARERERRRVQARLEHDTKQAELAREAAAQRTARQAALQRQARDAEVPACWHDPNSKTGQAWRRLQDLGLWPAEGTIQ